MRTTLTLDPDVAEKLRREVKGGKKSLKQVVNERIRIGYGLTQERPSRPFKVIPHSSGYRPGVDRMKLNQLVDEMELDALEEKAGGPNQ